MPAVVAWLLSGLITIAGTVAGRVMLSLGFSLITYGGIDTTLTWLKEQAISSLTTGAATVVPLLAYMKVGVVINIIVSATAAKLLLNGLSSGALKKWVTK